MFKIDFTGFCILFINWKIYNPSEGKAIFIGQIKLFANHVAGAACNGLEGFGFPAQEKRSISHVQAKLLPDRFCALWPDIFGQRPRRFHAVFAATPENIAHTGQAFFLRKRVHPVAKLAAAAPRRGDGANFGALLFQ